MAVACPRHSVAASGRTPRSAPEKPRMDLDSGRPRQHPPRPWRRGGPRAHRARNRWLWTARPRPRLCGRRRFALRRSSRVSASSGLAPRPPARPRPRRSVPRRSSMAGASHREGPSPVTAAYLSTWPVRASASANPTAQALACQSPALAATARRTVLPTCCAASRSPPVATISAASASVGRSICGSRERRAKPRAPAMSACAPGRSPRAARSFARQLCAAASM